MAVRLARIWGQRQALSAAADLPLVTDVTSFRPPVCLISRAICPSAAVVMSVVFNLSTPCV